MIKDSIFKFESICTTLLKEAGFKVIISEEHAQCACVIYHVNAIRVIDNKVEKAESTASLHEAMYKLIQKLIK